MYLRILCGIWLVLGCTASDNDCPPGRVPLYYARFAKSGGLYDDTTTTLAELNVARLDSVLRFYGDSITLGAPGTVPCIPEALARDTALPATSISKAFDEDWLEEHVRRGAGDASSPSAR